MTSAANHDSAPLRVDDDVLAKRILQHGLLGDGLLEDEFWLRAPPKYEMLRRLGRGGSGVVHLARETELDRLVALKFLTAERAGIFERFRREARYTARLSDDAIVRIHELGQYDGRPYIAMEYIDGGSLTDARLTHVRLAEIVRDVARALDHCHSQGIVHRDIKPANILLRRDGRPVLTDFGIARDLFAIPGHTLSFDGAVIGTPSAMAPEQARGDLHAVDARSDIYSLGASLYAKLAGRWPFESASVVDVLHSVVHDPPPLPRSFDPTIPRALESITMRCLAKDKSERYGTMAEFASELDRFLAGLEVEAESRSWAREHAPHGATERSKTSASPDDAWLDLGIAASRELASWDVALVRATRGVDRQLAKLDAVIDLLSKHLERHPDTAWARYYRGVARFRRGDLDLAIEDMERSVDAIGGKGGAFFELGRLYLALHLRGHRDARRHISPTGVRGHLDSMKGRLNQAAEAFREARRLREDVPPWHFPYADAVAKLAEDDFQGSIATCDSILASEPEVEEVWKLRGDAMRLAGLDPTESYQRAVAVRKSFHEAWFARAEHELESRRFAAARESLARVREIRPDLCEVDVLSARAALFEARETGGSALLATALSTLETLVARMPDLYEPRVLRAEVRMELGRRGDESAFGEAIADLTAAKTMQGCQNRVNYLECRAYVDRARIAIRNGRDGRGDLDRVLRHSSQPWARIDGETHWRELFAEARRLAEGDAG